MTKHEGRLDSRKQEHTPTPWSTVEILGMGKTGVRGVRPICDAMVRRDQEEGEAEANAAFIVKAVNSHEALVEALRETRNALLWLAQEAEARAGVPKAIIGGARHHAEKANNALKLAEGA